MGKACRLAVWEGCLQQITPTNTMCWGSPFVDRCPVQIGYSCPVIQVADWQADEEQFAIGSTAKDTNSRYRHEKRSWIKSHLGRADCLAALCGVTHDRAERRLQFGIALERQLESHPRFRVVLVAV